MPRTARIAPKDFAYHVLARGNNRQDIFLDEEDYQKYLDILLKYKEKYRFYLYHYVLMTNHVHLVEEPTEEGGELSQIMKGINLSYAQYFKAKYKYIGHVWQDRYKSIIISKDDYLLACGSYVELNPVRAGIVKNPSEYKWSSHNTLAYGKKSSVIDRHPSFKAINKNEDEQQQYRKFVKEMLDKNSALKGEMDRRLVYGNADFSQEISRDYKVETLIRKVGRPARQGESSRIKNK